MPHSGELRQLTHTIVPKLLLGNYQLVKLQLRAFSPGAEAGASEPVIAFPKPELGNEWQKDPTRQRAAVAGIKKKSGTSRSS